MISTMRTVAYFTVAREICAFGTPIAAVQMACLPELQTRLCIVSRGTIYLGNRSCAGHELC